MRWEILIVIVLLIDEISKSSNLFPYEYILYFSLLAHT